MPVKLRVTVHGEPAGVSRTYVLELDGKADHAVALVGPAEARQVIAEGRLLLDQMEEQLELAGTIDVALLDMIAAPHPTAAEGANPPEGDAPAGGASAHCQGEGQRVTGAIDGHGR